MSLFAVVDCGDPGAPRNGLRELSSTVLHSDAQYSCNHGYKLVGDKVRFCLASGEWSGFLPVCKRKLVPSNSIFGNCGFMIYIYISKITVC